jgi:DNA end-binding protein Ku
VPRAIWTGAISFGLVNVPVKLYAATETKDVRFHQFRAGSNERIRYKRVGEESGDEVDYDDIVKGYEISDGRYVTLDPDELEAVEPGQTRTIEIEDFVLLDQIDPIYFEKTYYLGPSGAPAAKPYELLRTVLEDTGKVAIARFVMRTKQYLAAVRAAGGLLVLETLFFGDEVRAVDGVPGVPVEAEVAQREIKVAEQLIDSLTTDWDPDRYEDTYRERVLDLIDRKAEGEEVVVERPEQPAKVVDLMAALEASVQAAKDGRPLRSAAPAADDDAESDLDDRSVDELRDLARRRDISGRSKMNKEELIDALREAS